MERSYAEFSTQCRVRPFEDPKRWQFAGRYGGFECITDSSNKPLRCPWLTRLYFVPYPGHEAPTPPSSVLPNQEFHSHGQLPPTFLRANPSGRQEQNPHGHKEIPKNFYGVSVVCSVAINEEVQMFDDNNSPQKWPLSWRKADAGVETYTCEVITAYKLRSVDNPQPYWNNQIIPWSIMKAIQPHHGGQAAESPPRCGPAHDSSIVAPEDTSSPDDEKGAQITYTKMKTPHMIPPVGTPGKDSSKNSPGTPQNHLDFAHRRNLEHILSVCAVQMRPQAQDAAAASKLPHALKDVDAVALTCGDMSGHRICWSASL